MATLWENLLGRARTAGAPRGAATGSLDPTHASERRYLAIVARDRPDLVSRVNRLFLVDRKVEAILDRRHGERRRRVEPAGAERRRADRREGAVEQDLAVEKVVIARATRHGVPERLAHWVEEGRDLLLVLRRSLDEVGTLAREVSELRAETERLRSENETLRGRHARMAAALDEITRPLGEIVERLRVA